MREGHETAGAVTTGTCCASEAGVAGADADAGADAGADADADAEAEAEAEAAEGVEPSSSSPNISRSPETRFLFPDFLIT